MIYIPAGLPHGSQNHSGAPERHLEILIPAVQPGAPFLKPVQCLDDVQMPATLPRLTSGSGPRTEVTGHETRWALSARHLASRSSRHLSRQAHQTRRDRAGNTVGEIDP